MTVTYFHLERLIGNLEVGTYTAEISQVEEVDIENKALILTNAYVPFSDIYTIESETFDQIYEDASYGESI